MSNKLIEVKNLKKYFNTPMGNLHAVDDVSVSIDRGKTLGVVGESGCGKSTLGKTIIRLHEPTEGEVLFKGENIFDYSKKDMKKLRSSIQIIFQDPYSSLNPRMTVSRLIAEPLISNKIYKSKREMEDRIKSLMETVGLSGRLYNAYPHELDGGRRQRIGIARALAMNPDFIICDEPVSALDVSIQAQILNLLMDLQEELELTYLFITHDLSVVKHISDEILVMYLGQSVEKAPYKELFDNPIHPYTKALLGSIPKPILGERGKIRNTIKGEIFTPINPASGCRFAKRCDYAKEKCYVEDPVFIEVSENHFVACHI